MTTRLNHLLPRRDSHPQVCQRSKAAHPNSEVAAVPAPGSTGNLPVPRGDSPRGMEKAFQLFCAVQDGKASSIGFRN